MSHFLERPLEPIHSIGSMSGDMELGIVFFLEGAAHDGPHKWKAALRLVFATVLFGTPVKHHRYTVCVFVHLEDVTFTQEVGPPDCFYWTLRRRAWLQRETPCEN